MRAPSRRRPRRRELVEPPEGVEPQQLTKWLQNGVIAGHVGALWEGSFPRYVWYRKGGTCYEARLVNAGVGEYKGYPLTNAECPDGV